MPDDKYISGREQYILELEAKVSRLERENKNLGLTLEQSEKFSQVFYKNQTPMIIAKAKDGIYIDVNNKFAELVGFDKEEIIGKTGCNWGYGQNPKLGQI